MNLGDLIIKGLNVYEKDFKISFNNRSYEYLIGNEYKTWMFECINYLESKYPKHRVVEEFINYQKQAESGCYDTFDSMLAILKSCKNIEEVSSVNKAGNKQKVFISHSSKDEEYVSSLVNFLESFNIEVFYSSDERLGINAGKDILSSLESELNSNPVMIFLISQNFIKSIYCMCELGVAWNKKLKKYAFCLPNTNIDDKEYQELIKFLPKCGSIINKKYIENFCESILDCFNVQKKICNINNNISNLMDKLKMYEFNRRNVVIYKASSFIAKKYGFIDITSLENDFKEYKNLFLEKSDDIEIFAFMEKGKEGTIIKSYLKVKKVNVLKYRVTGEVQRIEERHVKKMINLEKLYSINEILNELPK